MANRPRLRVSYKEITRAYYDALRENNNMMDAYRQVAKQFDRHPRQVQRIVSKTLRSK